MGGGYTEDFGDLSLLAVLGKSCGIGAQTLSLKHHLNYTLAHKNYFKRIFFMKKGNKIERKAAEFFLIFIPEGFVGKNQNKYTLATT